MLSKFYCDTDREVNKADATNVSALYDAIGKLHSGKDVTVERLFPGGTLGTFWSAIVDRKKFFIKTCTAGKAGQINLHKEIEIMKVLYEGYININSFFIEDEGAIKEFLIMDYINSKNDVYGLRFVQELIKKYNTKTSRISSDIINYNIDDLYSAARISFEILDNANLFSVEVNLWCERLFRRLVEYAEKDRILCHGDLSNKNIMIWKENVLVLDWEDALLAYPDYDMLYWLTFYSQRRYYSCHLFDDIGVKEKYGKDIMVLILLVKCCIAYRNKTYLNNRLSFNERINEVICM